MGSYSTPVAQCNSLPHHLAPMAAMSDKQPAVAYAMKRLEETIALLGATSDQLVAKILPILQHPSPREQQDDHGPCTGCDLADGIVQRSRSLETIEAMLRDALDRVEV